MFALRCFLLIVGVLEAEEDLLAAALGVLDEKNEVQLVKNLSLKDLPPSKELLLKVRRCS